ncbi:TonB-dependent receptor, plug [Pelobacter propionicus DSM 2379]|uniref:TonB-dependent receptor, plug n=2 Tax=Pelobacter propionicus TaxID=29543 RepID=A1ANF4_PELPD|nr:TonB-dependent receptor, plug [Pelobacter propionicus DSM 2379]
MRKLPAYLGVLSLICSAVPVARGEEASQDRESMKHLTMEEIVVTDTAVTDPAATVVGVKTIEKGRSTTIPDVLENEAGIDISRKALVGDTGDTLKIRGLSGNRIMLNIDGRSVNAAGVQGGYFVDWSTIPLDNIEKVEVIYGGGSVKYGNNAGGGVINVITKKPTEKPTVSMYGNFGAGDHISDMQNYRVTHTYKVGPIGYSIAGSYQHADEYLWNNDYEAKNIAAKLYVDMPFRGEMTLGMQYTDVDRGFALSNRLSSKINDPNYDVKRNDAYPLSSGDSFSPGAGNVTTAGPGANWNKTKYLLDFGYKQPIGTALVEFKAYKNHEDRHEKNYSANWINSSYSNGKLVLDRTVKSDRSYGGSLELFVPIRDHEIAIGAERKIIATGGQDVDYVDTAYGVKGTVADSNGDSAHMWGIYLQDSWSVTDSFLLTPGVRYDLYKGPTSEGGQLEDYGVSFSLTGTYKLTDSDVVTASVYRKYLTPSAPDAAWWSDGYGQYYTKELKLERNNAIEMAYQHSFSPKDYLKLSAYHYMIDDYISRFSRTDGRGCYNIDRVRLTGVSLEGATEPLPWVALRGNVTYQKSKKKGDSMDPAQVSDELEYLPEWKGNAGVDFRLPYAATFSVKERVVGITKTVQSYTEKGTTTYKRLQLSPHATTDIELRVPVTQHGELSVYCENLLDHHYQERYGYALPGRIVGASAKVSF